MEAEAVEPMRAPCSSKLRLTHRKEEKGRSLEGLLCSRGKDSQELDTEV